MALTLVVAIVLGLILVDIVVMTVGVDSQDWEAETLHNPLHTDR
jgi:hypothetical protein